MSIRDSHLVLITLLNLLASQLNRKFRFLERGKYIFNASKGTKGKESLHIFPKQHTGDKDTDIIDPSKHLCVAQATPLQKIHATNPIPVLT